MEFLWLVIALLVIVGIVFAVVRVRKTFAPELERARRIRRANRHNRSLE